MDIRLSQDPFRWDTPPERAPHPWHAPPSMPGPTGTAEGLPPWLEERLFERRIVMIRGPLTGPAATQAAAALLTLDAMSADPVEMHVASPDGELTAAFAVVDALDAMRAEVRAVVTAEAGGAVLAVLAAAKRRLAYRHARLRIAEPRAAAVSGTADEVAAAAGQYLRELEELALRLAAATGQPRSRVEDDMSAGRILTATQAMEYGLIDEVVGGRDEPA
jgi:ATP-dependent Clp protease, protease subunit